ncbi:hypothetical protein LPU83_pLPU83b_0258 (plasmid) [Rhizobium favelukesii]|uniref:Uncharacterized protein n=1 Tax=Rhizobium favelukesii TaxID=348824 RepID=W6RHG1_9HYPH|nr:hypothetical protein LPU83_pLPU83b_0258 [Rhizobium favelukesii]
MRQSMVSKVVIPVVEIRSAVAEIQNPQGVMCLPAFQCARHKLGGRRVRRQARRRRQNAGVSHKKTGATLDRCYGPFSLLSGRTYLLWLRVLMASISTFAPLGSALT